MEAKISRPQNGWEKPAWPTPIDCHGSVSGEIPHRVWPDFPRRDIIYKVIEIWDKKIKNLIRHLDRPLTRRE